MKAWGNGIERIVKLLWIVCFFDRLINVFYRLSPYVLFYACKI